MLEPDLDHKYSSVKGFTNWSEIEIDADRFSNSLNQLFSLKSQASPEIFQRMVSETVLRAAAFESGALEDLYEVPPGSTMSVALDAPGWRDSLRDVPSAGIPDALQVVNDQFSVYAFLASEAKSPGSYGMNEAWIRELQRDLVAGQPYYTVNTSAGMQKQRLVGGTYKSYSNHVRSRNSKWHSYAPVLDTRSEMQEMVQTLRQAESDQWQPLLLAAYAHWALVHIHPFPDGNGRTARALASFYLLQHTSLPFLVFADRKSVYFQALERADAGDIKIFADYVLDRFEDTVTLVLELAETQKSDTATETRLIGELVGRQGGAPRVEAPGECATRLKSELYVQLKELASDTSVAGSVDIEVGVNYGGSYRSGWSVAKGYPVPEEADEDGWMVEGIEVRASVTSVQKVRTATPVYVYSVNQIRDSRPVMAEIPGKEHIQFRLEDLSPELSEAAKSRVSLFAKRIVAASVAQLRKELQELLFQHGTLND